MRLKRALWGYDEHKVKAYLTALNTEILLLEEQREEKLKAYVKEQAELLSEVEEVSQDLAEVDRLETNLKQWIQKNQL
ncbi:hypothetical protein [Paenibacillus thalictri]|uniref:Uncharacterized protein n=1 Tax=Paenibacillus thalictri TaxID=2527873 RepID=A0A4Q9DHL1_9BACL|nr:hypothetical protein [Paenibacillus thalictri]TBL69302.1 hypothetical protein EYB31_36180 [Paenibacillus thalictri]